MLPGTDLFFEPGLLLGGTLEHVCSQQRSIGYFLEPLCMLAPFAKKPMRITLKGITNGPDDPSVSWCACPHWEQGSGGKGGRFFVYCRVPNEDTKFNKMWVFLLLLFCCNVFEPFRLCIGNWMFTFSHHFCTSNTKYD